jgi:hypothetical protein
VSLATYRLNVRDKRRAWDDQARSQAEQVAGWLTRERCEQHDQMEGKAHVRNGSKLPVYDVVYVVRDRQDLDAAMPEFIPMVPPETTWDFFPTWFGDDPEGNPKVYMTSRDGRDSSWQRDSHGRLSPTRRPVDNAPPAHPVIGRIDYSNAGSPRTPRLSPAEAQRLKAEGLLIAFEQRSQETHSHEQQQRPEPRPES